MFQIVYAQSGSRTARAGYAAAMILAAVVLLRISLEPARRKPLQRWQIGAGAVGLCLGFLAVFCQRRGTGRRGPVLLSLCLSR